MATDVSSFKRSRKHHYSFAHHALPTAIFDPESFPLLFADACQPDSNWLQSFWESVGSECVLEERVPAKGLDYQMIRTGENAFLLFLTFPEPIASPEAKMAAVLFIVPEASSGIDVVYRRIFLLERAPEILPGPVNFLVCEWVQEPGNKTELSHVNYGLLADATKDAFLKKTVEICLNSLPQPLAESIAPYESSRSLMTVSYEEGVHIIDRAATIDFLVQAGMDQEKVKQDVARSHLFELTIRNSSAGQEFSVEPVFILPSAGVALETLLSQPIEERSDDWFIKVNSCIGFAALSPLAQPTVHGPDGMPYYQFAPCQPEDRNPQSLMLMAEYCIRMGFGMVLHRNLNGTEPPYLVFSYGDLWSFYLYGTFNGIPAHFNDKLPEESTAIVVEYPEEEEFPLAVRRVISNTLQAVGVAQPKMFSYQAPGNKCKHTFTFNVFNDDFHSVEQADQVRRILEWYIPAHFGLNFFAPSEELQHHYLQFYDPSEEKGPEN